jgi:hypothetical protein
MNKNYSCTGYLVKASDLTKLLPERVKAKYATAVDEGDWERAALLATENWPPQLPPIETIFTLSDDAEFEDEGIHKGEMYAMFDESDLYKKVPTLAHSNLMVEGITPILRNWVDFG